jgi:hypothetical protein
MPFCGRLKSPAIDTTSQKVHKLLQNLANINSGRFQSPVKKTNTTTMTNFKFYSFNYAQKVSLWMLLSGFCGSASAQKEVVKETLTNKNYANTTEVHKKESATDADVLSQLEGNYGIGDEVRISIAPPPKISDSLSKKAAKPIDVKPLMPTIPEGDPPLQVTTKGIESKIETPPTVVKTTEKTIVTKTKGSAFEFEESKKSTNATAAKSTKSSASSKGFYSFKKASRSERFLFFFKKKQSKPKVTYHNKSSNKYGCYKFKG